jgi:ACS family tartrate transporter-like MFS transporter
MSQPATSAHRKFRWRILTPIVVLIVLSSLDRVNISFAALQMNDAIGLASQTYGLAVGIFFAGYLVFQFPSTALLTHIGARRWIAVSVAGWGVVALLMAFVTSPLQLYILRFLLGAIESGFAPGVVYYTTKWMPTRFRANTIAITMLAIPISVMIGGPLCGWLMEVTNPLALPGWRWMLLTEGAVTIALGCGAYFLFVDGPAEARWLSDAERTWIATELTREQRDAPTANFWSVLDQPRIWLASGVWAATLIGANGLIFWLPQVLKELSSFDAFSIGVLSALPWVGVAVGMFVNSWHSDKTQERYWHVGVALFACAASLFFASISPHGVSAIALLFAAGVGLGSAQGVFWAIPTAFLPRQNAVQGITLINLVGNVGSLLGPYLIGLIRAHQQSFVTPVWFVAAVLLVGIALLMGLRGRDALA